MFWEEKIDILKKKFSQQDFRDPFTEWPDILKKIEAHFIIRNNQDYRFLNWSESLKNNVYIRIIPYTLIYQEIRKLDNNINYWVVIQKDNSPTSKHAVYDCKPNALEELLSFTTSDFYIVDKKYKWLTFFKIDRVKNEVALFKSGNEQTPFGA